MARPSFKEVAEREALKNQQQEIVETPNQEINMEQTQEPLVINQQPTVVVAAKQEVKSLYGNKDKDCEQVLPKGFKVEQDFFVKIWKTQELEDKTLITIPSTIDFVVYDEENFNTSFKGYESGARTQFERVTGMKYQVLHNPNL